MNSSSRNELLTTRAAFRSPAVLEIIYPTGKPLAWTSWTTAVELISASGALLAVELSTPQLVLPLIFFLEATAMGWLMLVALCTEGFFASPSGGEFPPYLI
jgi:hypothetical protein